MTEPSRFEVRVLRYHPNAPLDVAVHDPRPGTPVANHPWRSAGRGRLGDAVFDTVTWRRMRPATSEEAAQLAASPPVPGAVRCYPYLNAAAAIYSPGTGDLERGQAPSDADWLVTRSDALGLNSGHQRWESEEYVRDWTPMVPDAVGEPRHDLLDFPRLGTIGPDFAARMAAMTDAEDELTRIRVVLSERGYLQDPEVPLSTQVADVLDALTPKPAPTSEEVENRCQYVRTARAFGEVALRSRCTLESGHPFDDPDNGEEHAVEEFPAAEYDAHLLRLLRRVEDEVIVWDGREYAPLLLLDGGDAAGRVETLGPLDEQILCDAYVGGRPDKNLVDDPKVFTVGEDTHPRQAYRVNRHGRTLLVRSLILTERGVKFLARGGDSV
jgi:hypothetical protein